MKASLIPLTASVVFLLSPFGIAAQSSYRTGTLIEVPVHTSTAPDDMIDSTPHLIGTDCWGAIDREHDAALVAVLPDSSRVVIGFCTNGEEKFPGVFSCSLSQVLLLTGPDGSHVFLEPGKEIPPHRYSGPAWNVKFRLETKDGKTLYRIQAQSAPGKENAYYAIQPPLQIKALSEDQLHSYFRSLCNTDKLSPGMKKQYCSTSKDSASPGTASDSKKSE
jgi:hypothetical protein